MKSAYTYGEFASAEVWLLKVQFLVVNDRKLYFPVVARELETFTFARAGPFKLY